MDKRGVVGGGGELLGRLRDLKGWDCDLIV